MKEPEYSTPPYIVFKRWGQIRDHAEAELVPDVSPDQLEQRGFYLGNAGGSAFEVTVQNFQISASVNAHSTMINCLSAGEEGFALVWLDNWLAARGKNLLQHVTLMELETSFFYGHGAKEGS